ncbi:MAG: hypothetical protein HF314_18535 [Ignavibacteria bacterium]|jgi:hypothetical protein|nr:hypothetical protein [Ignavibacteria bacterium]MCU7505086.1 hypothetical protein [Ignavibacteria bacterium]MCU7518082.1 hypothetical protein [Ignavibacteria bacterium]
MGSSDGKDIKTTKIVDKGPAKDCFNVVLIAEGFKADEQILFEQDCDTFIKAFNGTSPFSDCGMGINFYRINISSTDSGADDPADCQGGSGAAPKTYLDATFCTGYPKIRRLIGFDTTLATQLLNKEVPEWDQALVIVNTSIYGGAGGGIAITSTTSGWTYIAIHEMGHAAFGLGDEYGYWGGCPPPSEPAFEHHPAIEPVYPNCTIEKQRDKVKWRNLILATTPVPTTVNSDCTKCDTQADPMTSGTIGLYEGANYHHCGAYRPAYDCMMRNFADFCSVCSQTIRKKLAPYIHEADIAITPWGYAQTPPQQPLWQTPDIWGSPVVNQAQNDLFVRVRNLGTKISQPFKVRVSFVPFTTVVDLANEILIDEVSRPALPAGGTDLFSVNWDLTAPKLPAKYANFNHFCVIAQINAKECNITNNQAQNNFINVPIKPEAAPLPLRFEIANPWRRRATARLVLKSDEDQLMLEPLNFEPAAIPLSPGERRTVEVALHPAKRRKDINAIFEITQLLRAEGTEDEQTLGGISGLVTSKAEHPKVAEPKCPVCGGHRFVGKPLDQIDGTKISGAIIYCAYCGEILTASLK